MLRALRRQSIRWLTLLVLLELASLTLGVQLAARLRYFADAPALAGFSENLWLRGLLFAVTFIASIPAVILYGPMLDDSSFILGSGSETRVNLGAALELLVIVANLGTALVLYPTLKRWTPIAAISLSSAAFRSASEPTKHPLMRQVGGEPAEMPRVDQNSSGAVGM